MRIARSGAGKIAGKRRGLRVYLALFSLFLQLWATAGHFHPEDFSILGSGVLVATSGGAGTSSPAGGQPTLPAHDDCSLCFTLQLVGASAMPGAIPLPLPSEYGVAVLSHPPERQLLPVAHLLFQTRAPPIA